MWAFLWPMLMPIFRNQGNRWAIYEADFLGPICLADFLLFFFISYDPSQVIRSKVKKIKLLKLNIYKKNR